MKRGQTPDRIAVVVEWEILMAPPPNGFLKKPWKEFYLMKSFIVKKLPRTRKKMNLGV